MTVLAMLLVTTLFPQVEAPLPKVDVEARRASKVSEVPTTSQGNLGKWGPILDCESNGDWAISRGLYEGGLQFHPQTWDAYKPDGYPGAAYQATPEQQMYVAELVLAEQGWGAWPTCSRKAGYR